MFCRGWRDCFRQHQQTASLVYFTEYWSIYYLTKLCMKICQKILNQLMVTKGSSEIFAAQGICSQDNHVFMLSTLGLYMGEHLKENHCSTHFQLTRYQNLCRGYSEHVSFTDQMKSEFLHRLTYKMPSMIKNWPTFWIWQSPHRKKTNIKRYHAVPALLQQL